MPFEVAAIDDSDVSMRSESLNEEGVDTLVGMRRFFQPTHYLQHDGAADAVVPGLGEVAIVCENSKVRNRRDGIARGNSESTDFSRGPRTGIKKKILLRMDLLRIARSNVCVPDVGDGKNRPFGAKDDPSLIRKSGAQPSA